MHIIYYLLFSSGSKQKPFPSVSSCSILLVIGLQNLVIFFIFTEMFDFFNQQSMVMCSQESCNSSSPPLDFLVVLFSLILPFCLLICPVLMALLQSTFCLATWRKLTSLTHPCPLPVELQWGTTKDSSLENLKIQNQNGFPSLFSGAN